MFLTNNRGNLCTKKVYNIDINGTQEVKRVKNDKITIMVYDYKES